MNESGISLFSNPRPAVHVGGLVVAKPEKNYGLKLIVKYFYQAQKIEFLVKRPTLSNKGAHLDKLMYILCPLKLHMTKDLRFLKK